MFLWIYDLPNWLLCVLLVAVSVGLCWAFLFMLRPVMIRWAREGGESSEERHNHMVDLVSAGAGLLYGLLLGLIAVATYTTYSDNQKIVDNEANALGGLYRDASSYPQPLRGQLQGDIKEYVHYVVNEAWPQQQRGEVPGGGVDRITAMYGLLSSYDPPSTGKVALHNETLTQFSSFVEYHRQRLTAVSTSLPGALWWTLILGALVNLLLIVTPTGIKLASHVLFSGIFASLIGVVIFLIATMDNSFRGDFSIDPSSYEVIRDQLMNRF
ncbi:DUF4239 domain-containing protein [Amycolatopsis sp. NBC_00345]|uniref:bestrophin-like domain n=1 Tax=Amycolatopsis sp. NBC_00345 TaxID=2975955 RepID=UPI002E26BA42